MNVALSGAFTRNQKADIPHKKIANLRTALKKYILPDLPRYNFSAMALTGKGFEACLAQVSLRVFLDANPLEILAVSCQKAQEAGELKPSIERTTYRPALNLFVTWVEEQQWFIPKDQARIPKYIPRSHFGQNLQKTNQGNRCYHKEAYGLKESELTSKLQSQLKKLQNFKITPGKYILTVLLLLLTYGETRREQFFLFLLFILHRSLITEALFWRHF